MDIKRAYESGLSERACVNVVCFVAAFLCTVPLSAAIAENSPNSEAGITATKTMRVTVYYVYQMDPLDIGSAADFYWKAQIDGVWSSRSNIYKDQSVVDLYSAPWTYTHSVTYTPGVKELVVFELWDDDGLFDDRCDINRTHSRNGAQIWVDMATGDWNGYDDNWGGLWDVKFYLNGNEDGTGGSWGPDSDDNDCYMVFNIAVY